MTSQTNIRQGYVQKRQVAMSSMPHALYLFPAPSCRVSLFRSRDDASTAFSFSPCLSKLSLRFRLPSHACRPAFADIGDVCSRAPSDVLLAVTAEVVGHASTA